MTCAAVEDRDRVGPYRLVKAIGAGGSARIDLARIDRAYGFQRHVVVKRPLEHLRDDPRAAASLRREARIGGLLRHPNLVTVLDAGTHANYDYLVLEYVHGASLRTLMQTPGDGGRVRDCPVDVAIAIGGEIARGLHHAHELTDERGAALGLVHRDVSPGNVLIGLDGAVKLADFGIAKETRVVTLSGSMHGTVTYMAPEQCRGHAFDRRADVFSLGVIVYELVTGTRLFWADNDVASLHRVLSGNVPRPRDVRPAIPAALEDILLTALAHDPDQRFATARALAEVLDDHAARTGAILTARAIAGWAEQALGKRGVPWLATAPAPDGGARSDGSLVALIQATPDEPVPEAFGPSAAEVATLAPAPRRRRVLGAVIAAGLIAGSATTAIVMTRTAPDEHPVSRAPAPTLAPTSQARTAPDPAPDPSAVTTPPAPPPTAPGPAAPGPAAARDGELASVAEPVPGSTKRSPHRSRRPKPPPPETAPAITELPPPPPPPPPPAPAAAGSATTVAPGSRVKWDPTLLLPTDSNTGAGSKR